MTATLFLPQQDSLHIADSAFAELSSTSSASLEEIAGLLGCLPKLVDVLASGDDFVAYSVFDFEGGPPNIAGMRELTRLAGVEMGQDDDSTILGPLLVITL